MNCERARESFSDYVEGSLDRRSTLAFEAHLSDCRGCASDVAALRQTWTDLGSLPVATPPPGLAEQTIAAILREHHRARDGAATRPSLLGWLRSLSPARAAFATGLATLIVAGAIFVPQFLGPEELRYEDCAGHNERCQAGGEGGARRAERAQPAQQRGPRCGTVSRPVVLAQDGSNRLLREPGGRRCYGQRAKISPRLPQRGHVARAAAAVREVRLECQGGPAIQASLDVIGEAFSRSFAIHYTAPATGRPSACSPARGRRARPATARSPRSVDRRRQESKSSRFVRSLFFSASRARFNRDFTVPIGRSMIAAISS